MHMTPIIIDDRINIILKKIGWEINNIIFINKKKNKIKILIIILKRYKLKTFSKIFTLLRLISNIWEWRTICTHFITSFYFYKIILTNPIFIKIFLK